MEKTSPNFLGASILGFCLNVMGFHLAKRITTETVATAEGDLVLDTQEFRMVARLQPARSRGVLGRQNNLRYGKPKVGEDVSR